MTPFKLYISFDREIRNHKDGLQVNTAEATYWLNKALEEFVDKKYKDFEGADDVIQDLKGLHITGSYTTTLVGSTNPPVYSCTLPSNIRYITWESAIISVSGVTSRKKITPVTQDTINIKLKDPYSQHILHQGNAEPLRLMIGQTVLLTANTGYTITNYSYRGIKDPTLFRIQDATVTTALTELPHKAYKEVLAIAVRMFIENNSNARYNTYNYEVNKTEL